MKKQELEKKSCGSGSSEALPQKLNREDYFQCPIWYADVPQFVND